MTCVLEDSVRAASRKPTYPSKASSEERKALDLLAGEIEGAMIYTRSGRIKKVTIGDWREADLGEGAIVRWGPLGQRIAVLHDRALYVMNADGSERRRVIDNGLNGGCSIEFHTNGREILYITRDDEVWAVDIASGKQRNLKLPFDTELNISADGRHLVGRRRDNYCVELPDTQMRKFANGCSPCVSPDGRRITGNKGGHRTMDIRQWNGERLFEINARQMGPDHRWDNMHWSNHNDFIAMQGDGKQDEAYAFRISENQGTRLTWEGRTHYCDLFVSKDLKTGEDPREMTVAWAELKGDNRAVASAPKPERKQEAEPKKSDESREVASSGDAQGRAAKVREVTGGPTRVVWAQKRRKSNNSGERFRLVGFGTEDGKGERVILSGSRDYAKPVFTPDGNQVVYSNRSNNKMYVVNWDGSGHKEIGSGFASDVWRDPATGIVWLYYRAGDGKQNGAVMRQQLDNPNVREKIWDRTPTGAGNVPWFRLSADGTHFADAFPFSKCGVGDPINGEWEHYSKGCWPSLAPDNSYRFFVFRGNHREVAVYDADKKNHRNVDIAGGPGINRKDEMYYPRWSNDARFLTVTGPRGSDKEAIFLGRFNSNFTKTEKWVKISQNDDQDSLGDAWIESGWLAKLNQKPLKIIAKKQPKPKPQEDLSKFTQWPGNQKNLLFFWENNNATNQISLANNETGRLCQAVARGKAVFGRFYEMDLSGGAVLAQDVDGDLLKACKGSNELTIETTITPYNKTQDGPAHIVSFSNDSSSHNFVLGQEKDTLVLSLQTGQQDDHSPISLCKVQVGQPIHLVTTYQPGRLSCYVNGKRVHNSDRVKGSFSHWKPMHLLFGDAWNGGHDWSGAMEGVAIYARAISAAEAKHKHALYATRLRKRQPIDRLEVEGKLVEITPMPTVKALKEYSRGMVVYSYEVLNVLKGSEQAPKIQVQHWAILDRQLLPEIGQRKIGQVYKLQLESYDKHAQLESERSFNDCEDFDIPLYYDIAGRGVPTAQTMVAYTAPVVETPKIHLKVNCAGPSLADWESDDKYVARGEKGDRYNFKRKADTSDVSGPAPVDVYKTVRHRPHRYDFNLPDGEYLVRLHFSDDYDPKGNIRKMDFVIEDQRALKGFNVVAAAGGVGRAVVREIPIRVLDGNGLQIKGEDPRGGDVFAAGIEIISW